MTQLSEEQQQPTIRTGGEDLSIFDIMQRYRNDGSCERVIQDALRRFSPLDSDSQAAAPRTDRDAERVAMEGIKEGLRQRDQRAATAMRDKCVEKVKALRGQWHDQYVAADSSTREALVRKEMLFAQCCAARDIIKELESLTLDQVKPEKQ